MARSRDRDLELPPRHGRSAVLVLPAELDFDERPPVPVSYVLVLDASASGGAQRVSAVREAAAVLLASVEPGARLGVVVLRGGGAENLVPATGSAERARRQLSMVASGGRPPLAGGLRLGLRMAAEEATRPEGPVPVVIVFSDGLYLRVDSHALSPAARIAALGLPALVVDSSAGEGARMLARIADVMGAQLLGVPGADGDVLAAVARGAAAVASREPRWRAPSGRKKH